MTPDAPDLDRELTELESALGPGLREALRPPAADVPEGADRAVKVTIDGRAAEIRRALARRRRLWPVWAAAAALLLAAGVWALALHRRLPGDFDRSGRVDIIDAYLLAKRLESGEAAGADWDLTGDGRVDDADVRAVAARAVSVSEGDLR